MLEGEGKQCSWDMGGLLVVIRGDEIGGFSMCCRVMSMFGEVRVCGWGRSSALWAFLGLWGRGVNAAVIWGLPWAIPIRNRG